MKISFTHLAKAVLVAGLSFAAASAWAIKPGDKVADFKLVDSNGKLFELYKNADKKAIVIMVQGNGCPIVRLAVPAFREIRDQFAGKDVEFVLMNSNLQDDAKSVNEEAKEFEFKMRILLDSKQKIGETFGVVRTAEVFVIEPKTWTLKYHGSIDDRLSYEKQRPVEHHYLKDALDSVLAGKPVATPYVNAPGCLINFPNRKQG